MGDPARQHIKPEAGVAAINVMLPFCYSRGVMAIPNVKRYRITSPDGSQTASLMAVLPKEIDVTAYLSDAAKRFDWKAHAEAQAKQFKIRVGQQKQKKAK